MREERRDMAQRDFVLTLDMLTRATELLKGFKSETVQLRILDVLIAALAAPAREDGADPQFAVLGAAASTGLAADAGPQSAAEPA
jgi:hypothetical protein